MAVRWDGRGRRRDYKKEYERDHSSAEDRENRSQRNQARRRAGLSVGDSREVDHKHPLKRGGSSSKRNTRVVSRRTNRKKGSK